MITPERPEAVRPLRPLAGEIAVELAARLIPGDIDLQASLCERLLQRPELLDDAAQDMDAVVEAMVRGAVIYLWACADAIVAARATGKAA